jgi:hypothetical protein
MRSDLYSSSNERMQGRKHATQAIAIGPSGIQESPVRMSRTPRLVAWFLSS